MHDYFKDKQRLRFIVECLGLPNLRQKSILPLVCAQILTAFGGHYNPLNALGVYSVSEDIKPR